jgi:putative sterol carrier protein
MDIVVEGDQAHIAEAAAPSASVTFHCDTETYVLLMYGRLSLEAASAVGRLRIAGEQASVAAFGQWFKGA